MSNVRIIVGDVMDGLRTLADESVHCVVTSPPYFGLRDYKTGSWEGGSPECDHSPTRGLQGKNGDRATRTFTGEMPQKEECSRCGARRVDRQIGLERTPEEFVERLVGVFREVRRVLREDGTLWLNLGDSYNAYNGGAGPSSALSRGAQTEQRPSLETGFGLRVKSLKPKDLIGVPWRVAFALQEDGWTLRQDIVWSKPNPMPESVRDRCTKAHEYIFLLSKSARYHFDAGAIAEPAAYAGQMRGGSTNRYEQNAAGMDNKIYDTRNKRSVWEVQTEPYPEAHFATFPQALIAPCIKAGCPDGGTVLDPFMGAGTTGLVAASLGRNAVGCELNPAYAELATNRIRGEVGLWTEVELTTASALPEASHV